nr:GrBNV gp23-like protein [Apis mellifera nudivirus]
MEKKGFSEETQSCLSTLFRTQEDIGKGHPFVTVNNRNWELDELIGNIRQQPFVVMSKKSPMLDLNSILEKESKINTRLDELQMNSTKSAYIEVIRVEEHKEVKFWNAEMRNGKLYPPRMLIDLSGKNIEPGQSVRINTGYVIRVPFIAKKHSVEKDVIKIGEPTKQPDFIIVPLIMIGGNNNKNGGSGGSAKIITSCCPRDPDDTGLFTINFTLVSGKLEKLQVVLNAYNTCRPLTSVFLLNPEPNAEIFKPKDSRSGRLVKNPKIKIHFDSLERNTDGSGILKTFNSLVSPIVTYDNQKVCINGVNVLFVNRKREWINPNLLCTPGLYNYKDGKRSVVPGIYKTDNTIIDKNTHGMVFIESRLSLFSQNSTTMDNLLYLNGAFKDLPYYEEAHKAMKQLVRGLKGLQQGYEKCLSLKTRYAAENLKLDDLLRLYDYHRNVDDQLDQLKEKTALNDEEMFKSQTVYANPYSVTVRNAMTTLANIFSPNNNNNSNNKF